MLATSGFVLLLVSLLAYANPRIRNLESEIPDAVPDTAEAVAGVEDAEEPLSAASPIQG